jgi:hypothetical protein
VLQALLLVKCKSSKHLQNAGQTLVRGGQAKTGPTLVERWSNASKASNWVKRW